MARSPLDALRHFVAGSNATVVFRVRRDGILHVVDLHFRRAAKRGGGHANLRRLHPLGDWKDSDAVLRFETGALKGLLQRLSRALADDEVLFGTLEAVPFGPKPALSFAHLRDLTLAALASVLGRELPDTKALVAARRVHSAQKRLEIAARKQAMQRHA